VFLVGFPLMGAGVAAGALYAFVRHATTGHGGGSAGGALAGVLFAAVVAGAVGLLAAGFGRQAQHDVDAVRGWVLRVVAEDEPSTPGK
jgi:hypothetical protein